MKLKIDKNPQDFNQSITIMENHVNGMIHKEKDELIWLLNYPSIYTCGASDSEKDLLDDKMFPVFRTSRGGKYTYHGPGQRVVYLMIELKKRNKGIKEFIKIVEYIIINILNRFNLQGVQDNEHHGIFIRKKNDKLYKIASVGMKFKKWITYHGFSININPNLSHYKGIKPCGLNSNAVTSLEDLGIEIDQEEFDDIVIQEINNTFN